MKRLNPLYAALLAATAASMLSTPAAALEATGTFNVVVLVNPVCVLTTSSTRIVFTYTGTGAAGTAVVSGSPTFTATCTNSLQYTLQLDGTESGTSGLYSYGGSANAATFNLAYSLQLRDTGVDFGSTTVKTGTGSAQTYTLLGTMANNQTNALACTSASGGCGVTEARTLTATY